LQLTNLLTMSDYTLLSCVESVMIEPTELYGRFALGNFTKGQSLTIANALRRCLLSELIGCSICFVEIRGIEHEYESLPGMKESVLDVLFNLRQVTLKSDKTLFNSQLAYLNVLGPGVIRARDLKLPYFISVVDPNQYIATLSPNSKLVMKLIINCGKTYLKHTPSHFDYKNHITKLKQRSWFRVGYQPEKNLAYSNQWSKERSALLRNREQEGVKKSTLNKPKKIFKLTLKSSESTLKTSEAASVKSKLKSSASTLALGSVLEQEPDFKSSKIASQLKKLDTSTRLFNDPLADHLQEGFSKQTQILNPGLVEKIGYFPIDAIFAPILKATYTIESISQTKEKIYFEIWTNGSIEPRQAIHKASKALIELFLPLQGFKLFAPKTNPLVHLKPNLNLKFKDIYNFKFKSQFKSKSHSNKTKKTTSETSITKQNEVESFIYWLKIYVKKNPKMTLKIVKTVLKPKTYVIDVKFGIIRANAIKPIDSLSATEKLFHIQSPLIEHRLEDRIIVKSKAQSKEKEVQLKKPITKRFNLNARNYDKKLTKKQRLKKNLKTQKQNQKLLFQKSLLYFKYVILNIDLSQLNFPYHIYLGLKTNDIHNIEQLINLSSDKLKKMLQLNSKDIKLIQITLKNYVIEHLTCE